MRLLTLLVVSACFSLQPAAAQAAEPVTDNGMNRPPGVDQRPGSVLDPPADGTGYRFSIAAEPKPGGWSLLLGALLSGGFIVRRRLTAR